jgi:hypothetical protein
MKNRKFRLLSFDKPCDTSMMSDEFPLCMFIRDGAFYNSVEIFKAGGFGRV